MIRKLTLILLLSILAYVYATAQKNVLFIMADDLNRWAGVNDYYPYPNSQTPNIDALASRGVYFSNANSSFPVCNPSRNSLWSGFRPTTSGIITNQGGFIRDQPGFENIVTMHQYFKENGYHTIGGGKLYHATSMGSYDTDPDNWNMIIDLPTGSDGGDEIGWRSSVTGNDVISWSAGEFDINTAEDTKLALAIADEIDNYDQGNKPFFIACGFFRPHLPWNIHKQFFDLYDTTKITPLKGYLNNDLDDIVSARPSPYHADIIENNKWTEAIWAYLSASSYADYNIGIVLNALNSSRHKDNTLIVICGDHGWHLGEKMQWGKGTEYEQSNRTLLAIYDPSSDGNGLTCSMPVSLQDLYPTLIEITNLPVKNNIEGNSLATLLDDPQDPSWNIPILMHAKGSNIIKTNQWRFVQGNTDTKVTPQLYNMIDDPHEFTNLYNDPYYTETVDYLNWRIDSMIQAGTALRENIINGTGIVPHPDRKISYLKSNLISDNTLHLDLLTTDIIARISVYDLSGQKLVDSYVAGEQDIDFPLPSGFTQGIYVLKISSDGVALHTQKFMVVK
ncbi:MAG: sulfatase-like hydrolase/transferase [Bacteroidetes bacterium]|nr:sulfatase-like hydrolase/transferase [Bacteroidota bacterium]